MLPKQERIRKKDFPKKKTPLLRRVFLWGSISCFSEEAFSTAVVISKKTLKTAVLRNKARRRVYSAIQRSTPRPPSSMVVYPNKDFLTTPFQVIKNDVEMFLLEVEKRRK